MRWGYVSAEYERAVGGITVGAASSYGSLAGRNRIASVEAKARYYPVENGLRGLSAAVVAGYTRVTASMSEPVGGVSLGTSVDYNWLLGQPRRVVVGVGVGAKRVFERTKSACNSDWISRCAYPTGRLVIGLAF